MHDQLRSSRAARLTTKLVTTVFPELEYGIARQTAPVNTAAPPVAIREFGVVREAEQRRLEIYFS
jgi:hypothetical protein